jgi:hypothetical protein
MSKKVNHSKMELAMILGLTCFGIIAFFAVKCPVGKQGAQCSLV